MSGWAAEVKARGVADVAAAFGLEVRARGVTNTSVSPCPACTARHRQAGDPRGPIGLTTDGLGFVCHRCKVKGDAVTLAALVEGGTAPGRGDTARWRAVAALCERHGLCAPSPRGTSTRPRPRVVVPPPPPAPIPAPRRPPEAEVRDLWARCGSVMDDAEARAWITGRALNPAQMADRDLARALPRAGSLPDWCRYRGADWRASSHRVIVPMYGAGGRLESLHARAVTPETPKDKAASPSGAEVRGLVMADALGRRLLEGPVIEANHEADDLPDCLAGGAELPPAGQVIIAEGVPDFFTWATHYGDAAEDAPAVFGVIAGAWGAEIAATIPRGWDVLLDTHHDDAGDAYADTIRRTLVGWAVYRRPRTRVSTYPRIQIPEYHNDAETP